MKKLKGYLVCSNIYGVLIWLFVKLYDWVSNNVLRYGYKNVFMNMCFEFVFLVIM